MTLATAGRGLPDRLLRRDVVKGPGLMPWPETAEPDGDAASRHGGGRATENTMQATPHSRCPQTGESPYLENSG